MNNYFLDKESIQCFQWITVDINPLLPQSWQSDLLGLIDEAFEIELLSKSVTSREDINSSMKPARFLYVDGEQISKKNHWLPNFYQGHWLKIAQAYFGSDVVMSSSIKNGIIMNILNSVNMRYESHVDSNAVTCLFFVTTIEHNAGGELVVSRNKNAKNIEEIEMDSVLIRPEAGKLLFFDARTWPHYVRPLKNEGDIRAAVVMNYYSSDSPESLRPRDLDMHLGFGSMI